MNKIYSIVAGLRNVFMGIASQYTNKRYESDDAVQILMLYFMQMNPKSLKEIYDRHGRDGILKYGAVSLRRSLTSPRSEFYYKYKKCYENEFQSKWDNVKVSDIAVETKKYETWEYFEKIDKELDKMYWYDAEIYRLYYSPDGETLDNLAKKTGISRNSLFTTIDNIRKHLKKVLSDE
tara:strand:- start:5961 stop:6494 length:534 start_codon:yes stop_codon:yes gene_type:complete